MFHVKQGVQPVSRETLLPDTPRHPWLRDRRTVESRSLPAQNGANPVPRRRSGMTTKSLTPIIVSAITTASGGHFFYFAYTSSTAPRWAAPLAVVLILISLATLAREIYKNRYGPSS